MCAVPKPTPPALGRNPNTPSKNAEQGPNGFLLIRVEGGESIEDFLDGFPSVKREQVIAVIEAAKLKMLETV